MALELLNCTICPKKPFFSDTSHLLTHIGSKGHLSHLHKLQVRSHGDLEASHQLSIYNAWYLEHNLADLLADRMQQKHIKQATQQVGNRRRKARTLAATTRPAIGQHALPHAVASTDHPATITEPDSQRHKRDKRRVMQEEMDDPDYVPSLPLISQNAFIIPSTPIHRSSNCDCGDMLSHGSGCSFSSLFLQPLEFTRLKGQVWPGMDVFDSATEEQARKRNQRKDRSVVMVMHANSMKIEPFEVTYSTDGVLKRKRHLDNLDDESNLLEGETPVKKPTVKRQKRLRPKEEIKDAKHVNYQSRTPRVDENFKSTPPSVIPFTTSSSILARFLTDQPSSSPPMIETKKGRARRTQKQTFTVYQDAIPPRTNVATSNTLPNPFLNPPSEYRYARDIDVRLGQLPWYQPSSMQVSPTDPFKDTQRSHQAFHARPGVGDEKENAHPFICKQEFKEEYNAENDPMHFGSLYNLSPDLGPLSHVYAYTRNPLLDISTCDGKDAVGIQDFHPVR